MTDELMPITFLNRVADQQHFTEGLELEQVPCDDCGEMCWRSVTTPKVHVHQDGSVQTVRNVCTRCYRSYAGREITYQPLTDAQLIELRALPDPNEITRMIIEQVDAHPDQRLSAIEYLALALGKAGRL